MRTNAFPYCTMFFFHARLQAELEEAKEEARIKAQEEIVVRIQEAKVTLAKSFLMQRQTTKIIIFDFLSRRPPNKK